MANKTAKKQAAKKPAAKNKQSKPSTAKRGRPSKQAKRKAEIDRLWSIVMFAAGALLTALTLIPGDNLWAVLRSQLFGVFGTTAYIVGPVIIYIGCLTFNEKPVRIKFLWAFRFVLLASNLIHIMFVGETAAENAVRAMKLLHSHGMNNKISGGALSWLIAYPMGKHFGLLPARITILILTITFFMLLTDTTPFEIYKRAQQKAREEAEKLRVENEKIKAEKERRRLEKEKKKLEAEREAEILELTKPKAKPRIDFDLDSPKNTEPEKSVEVLPKENTENNPDADDEFKTIFDSIQAKKHSASPDIVTAETAVETKENTDLDDVLSVLDEKKPEIKKNPYMSVSTDGDTAPQRDIKAEKKANTLTQAEKDAILPLSETADTERKQVYKNPPIELFDEPKAKTGDGDDSIVENARILVDTLKSFGVETEITDYSRGPAVTRYELRPKTGVKISRITSLADDIALNLATSGVRIEAPIPGKAAVGIEVPNRAGNSVFIRSILKSSEFRNAKNSPLTIALGEGIDGMPVVTDLTKMPHLLIAGSTGSGKSVCINSIIMSFIYKSTPDEVKLILIDPKVVELAEYNGIPHLLMPVVTEPKKAAGALGGAVAEMEKRYLQFAQSRVRDIKSYNVFAEKYEKAKRENPSLFEEYTQQRLNQMSSAELEELEAEYPDLYIYFGKEIQKMPYIAVVIDELADLMMVCGKEVEDYICRLAQKARAAGIHLVVATQRPSVDVITGLIKANIPARIAFAVSSAIDSRTILDSAGAEKLLGNGDMLFLPIGAAKPVRVQGTWVKDAEISRVISYVKKEQKADYSDEMIENMNKFIPKGKTGDMSASGDGESENDEMFDAACETVIEAGQASTSLLQRKLKLGYARAARIMDQMERAGIVGAYEGSKPRQVKITPEQWMEMKITKND